MHIFISYSRKDRRVTSGVDDLAEALSSGGHDIWIDDQLRLGMEWKEQLRTAIQRSDAVAAALSPNWFASKFCQWEFTNAVELGKLLILAVIVPVELPERISKYQYIDFSQGFSDQTKVQLFLDQLLARRLERQSSATTSAVTDSEHPALTMARRVLKLLETQAAAYTSSSIPVHLQIAIDDKKREIAELESRQNRGY
jgi:hypothetical protein